MSQDQSSTAPSAGVDDSNPSSMNDMFALLLGEINKKYLRPANVEFLKTPRVNPLIWGQISAGTRAGDAKSQKIQHVLIGAVSAIVRATEYVLNKGGDQDLLTMLTDSIAFMLQCNHDHNHSRRLKRPPQGLCRTL